MPDDPELIRRLEAAAGKLGTVEAALRLAGDASTRVYYRVSYAERLEPQPNGDCRHRLNAQPRVSQVPSHDAGNPDVAPGSKPPEATKPKFGSQFPKESSQYDKKTRIGSTERLEPQPNGDCRHRLNAQPRVSQVPSHDAGNPDVAPGSKPPEATKPKFGSQFPKESSQYDKKTRIGSTERLEPQPNGDCRHRLNAQPRVSQVPSHDAGNPDVAPGSKSPGATKPRFGSQFPKESSQYEKNARICSTDHSTAIVMIQPDPGMGQEDSFLDVQRFLADLALPVPAVYLHDPREGVVILQDLGDDLLETVVEHCDAVRLAGLYHDAVDVLVSMRGKTAGLDSGSIAFTLAFDEEKLMQELHFFTTHFVQGLCKLDPSRSACTSLDEFFLTISRLLAREPRVFTHRDYHARNLLFHQGRLVMIDFQDARMGPAQYDLASLLRDSYVTLPEHLVSELIHHYVAETREPSQERFRYIFDVMSLQRNIKALGTFGYQLSTRGSNRYASSIPRTARYIAENISRYPEFSRYRSCVEDFICGPALSLEAPAQ